MDDNTSFALATVSLEKAAEMAEELEFKNDYYLDEIQKLANEQDAMKHKLETENALRKCTEAMADMLDEENEELADALNTACDEADRLEVTRSMLQDEVRELNEALDKTLAKNRELENENMDLIHQLGFIIAEENEGRRSYTLFQIAVSIMIFLYGMAYGQYFRC
jgi:chromosome segregation ATPase